MPDSDFAAREVLIVDDEPDIRELLAEYFRSRGFSVATAADGRAAVAAIERAPTRFGLVFTDLQLPGVDGLGVLRAVREANATTVVVIITGYASLDSAIQAVRLGAYDYLTKPFSLGQIDVVLKRISERAALEAENRALTRRVDGRAQGPAPAGLEPRLEAIENRLARIERLLRDLSGRTPGDSN